MLIINYIDYLVLALILFVLGVSGLFINRQNVIIILMSLELILLSVNFNFVVFSTYLDDLFGQLSALFVLTVAAAESSIGLAILVIYYRVKSKINVTNIDLMNG
jgi:NADH-quinone oxidoreductase subunit K